MSRSSRREPSLLPRLALLGVHRGLMRGGREMGVAEAAATAARDHEALLRDDEVREEVAARRIEDDRAGWHVELQVTAGLAMPPRARRPWPPGVARK